MERQVVFFQTLKYLISKKKGFFGGEFLKGVVHRNLNIIVIYVLFCVGFFFGRAFKCFLTLHCHVGFNVRF